MKSLIFLMIFFLMLNQAFATAWEHSLDSNLKNYYNYDETSGTIAIDYLNDTNGTITGATVNQTGLLGKAYSFTDSGSNNRVGFGSPTWNNAPLTWNGWIQLSTSVKYTNIFLVSRNGGLQIELQYRTWGDSAGITKPCVSVGGSAICSTTDLGTGTTWHMLTLTWSGTNDTNGMKLYVDGVLKAQGTSGLATQGAISAPTFFMGKSSSLGNNNSNFIADEIATWKRALSSSEITTLYNGGSGMTYTPFSDPCTRTLDSDWVVTTAIDCNSKTINLGTGKLILSTGAKLRLFSSNLSCNRFDINASGSQLHLGSGSWIKTG